MKDRDVTRYSTVAILLHWLIALLIFGMMGAGIWMTEAIKAKETQSVAFEIYQLHKSFGLSILGLSIFRLVWRVTHIAPPFSSGMARWEVISAHATHWLFYGLMIGLPITGWLMVSASPWGLPTIFFDFAEIPHFSVLSDLDQSGKILWEARFKDVHKYIAYSGIGLILLHVGAALKHHFLMRDKTLSRMAPIFKAK